LALSGEKIISDLFEYKSYKRISRLSHKRATAEMFYFPPPRFAGDKVLLFFGNFVFFFISLADQAEQSPDFAPSEYTKGNPI
jgi:hypothetical protein